MPPLVSILMPCHNAAPYVGPALDSVLAQTWPALEIIVVDDGSTDGSADIVAVYARHGVRLIRQEHSGQSVAANRAYAASHGAYVKFFDADDLMHPGMIERQMARLSGQRDAIALGEWARFHGDDPAAAQFEARSSYRDAAPADWLVEEWLRARPMMQCALWLIPREVLSRSGLWHPRLSLTNDFEFSTRVILRADMILFAPGARLFYRSSVPGSASGKKSRQAAESAFHALRLGTEHLLAAEDSPRTRQSCANMLQDFEHTFYPRHADLRVAARARADTLGGSDLAPDGPPGFHRLRRFVGWRAARQVQHLAERLHVNAAGRAGVKAR